MTQKTYYEDDGPAWSWWGNPPADVEPEVPEDDVHTVKWGYNLADLDRLAHIAACRAFGGYGSHAERYEAAWDGVVEKLLTATERPNPKELVHSGYRALNRWMKAAERDTGYNPAADATRPSYAVYWTTVTAPTPPPEERIIERLALWAIWEQLHDVDREVLLTLAASRDHHSAAASLGLTYQGYHTRLRRARRKFQRRWYEGETPPKQRHSRLAICARDPLGRTRITESQLEKIRDRYHAGERLKDIGSDYGVGGNSLSSLLTGRMRPVPDAESVA